MPTKLSPEEITQQQELLRTYRRTLAHLLQQAANYGGVSFAPPQTANGITEARAQIAQMKTALRAAGVMVEDDSNDEASPQTEPVIPPRATDTQVNTGGPVIGGMSGGTVINTGGDVIGGDKVVGDKVAGDKIGVDKVLGDKVLGDKSEIHHYYQPAITPLDRQQQRNRRAMLEKVKAIWIDGLLKQSLAEVVRIDLGLVDKPDAVSLPLYLQYQELNRQLLPIPSGTPIIDVFTQMGGELLILGAPGSGKTTMLLELARDLITRAEQDESLPIPVVFNLSSWAEKRAPLVDWLVYELNTRYDLFFGGFACIYHVTLRLMVYHNGYLPLRLVPFLDYCAERIFLRKVGGGYIFVHRLLMEHFASLDTTQIEEPQHTTNRVAP